MGVQEYGAAFASLIGLYSTKESCTRDVRTMVNHHGRVMPNQPKYHLPTGGE